MPIESSLAREGQLACSDGEGDTFGGLERVLRDFPTRWSRPAIAAARSLPVRCDGQKWCEILDDFDAALARVELPNPTDEVGDSA